MRYVTRNDGSVSLLAQIGWHLRGGGIAGSANAAGATVAVFLPTYLRMSERAGGREMSTGQPRSNFGRRSVCLGRDYY